MKYLIPSIDPVDTASGTVNNPTPNKRGTIWLYNDSAASLIIQLGQNQDRLLAGGVRRYILANKNDVPQLQWAQEFILSNSAAFPAKNLLIDWYTDDEDPEEGNSIISGRAVNSNVTATQANEFITPDGTEFYYLDNSSFAGVLDFTPAQYPTNTTASIDVGMAAKQSGSTNTYSRIWASNVASNIMQLYMHLQFPIGTLNIGGAQIFSGTGPVTGFVHGLGVLPKIVIVSPTNSAQAAGAGNYTTTTVDVFIASAQSWKMLIIV